MRCLCLAVAASAALVAAGGDNLLRADFQSDNCGGFVGWSQSGFGGSFTPDLIEGPDGVRAIRLVASAPDDKAEVM